MVVTKDKEMVAKHLRRDQTPMKKLKAEARQPYQVSLSIWFAAVLLLASTAISFHVGAHARQRILQQTSGQSVPKWLSPLILTATETTTTSTTIATAEVPSWVRCDNKSDKDDPLCVVHQEAGANVDDSDSDEDEEEEEDSNGPHDHKFVGQQLLMILDQIQDELVPSLLQHTAAKGWILESHYLQRREDESLVSAIFLFDDAHRIAINTVTSTLDIYSTDDEILLDWIDFLSSPQVSADAEYWTYRPRGAPYDPTVVDAGLTDLYKGMLGNSRYTLKRLVARHESPFQEVAIYDTIDPTLLDYSSYQAATSTTSNSNYYTDHAHMFQPDRQMFLDGVVQSRRRGEKSYHEALVHPPMMMHPNPQRVAIIGAGEGATLREVLKHTSLKQVVMIEIDQQVMDLSRRHLGQWNDCSDLILPKGMVNPTGNCFDDPRAVVYAEDAIRWFMDRYPENDNGTKNSEELFDVIIMDALDPGDNVEFSDLLFDNTDLVDTYYRALSPQGVFQCQMGEQQHMDDCNPMWTRDRHALLFLHNLGKAGFHRLKDYQEPSTRFDGVWSFLLASKATDSSRWYANQAEIDLELQQRAMPTKSGAWPFHYFDGSTMMTYQATSRAVAKIGCLTTPDSPACLRGPGLFKGINAPVSSSESAKWTTTNNGQVVATTDIPAGTLLGLEECVQHTWDIPHNSNNLIDSFASLNDSSSTLWKSWHLLTSRYGMAAPLVGEKAMLLDMGIDVWQRQCFEAETLLESLEPGVLDPMLERFWRIQSCAAKRRIQEDVAAGTNMVFPTQEAE
ncbi:Polyamine aminopropyltransferase [Seminavis robusta]|uniref:Polyamine aminopropyltransferase n=1 Tax=Seminavis robusta TaxID=568900 RepID=A0A9N8H1Q7_9STRA|nr:Polyamine aminopropyltransferase [Seminavis robusta]|eukprot:Sro6_g005430.1 Polyamine aminopropyltransferase (790) ;mRNA; r:184912-187281